VETVKQTVENHSLRSAVAEAECMYFTFFATQKTTLKEKTTSL